MPETDGPPLVYPVPPTGRGRLLRRLRVDRLWGGDPARAARLARVLGIPVLARLARGSAFYGAERIPREGGVLLAANHFTALDPVLVGMPTPRGAHFFAKGQLFRRSLLTELILWLGSIPVGVGFDNRVALRHALGLLAAGRVVGIFVEGERQKEEGLGDARPGAALLALRAGVPIVPCGVDTHGWAKARPRPCTVVFGDPLVLERGSGREQIAAATERIADEVEQRWREAVAATRAGQPERLPDGTRRRTWRHVWLQALTHRARP